MPEITFFSYFRSINYMLELLVAVNAIMLRWPKRKHFFWCFPLVCVLLIALSGLTVLYPGLIPNWYYVLLLFGQMGAVFVGMVLCYDVPKRAVFSALIGGVALQHIGYHLWVLFSLIPGFPTKADASVFIEDGICLVLYVATYFSLSRIISRNEYWKFFDSRMIFVAFATIFFTIIVMRFHRQAIYDGYRIYFWVQIAISCYAITSSSLSLFILFFLWRFVNLRSHFLLERRVEEEHHKQYEQQMASAELLNIKFHDLKHAIDSFRGQVPDQEIERIGAMLRQYDANISTGLPSLDSILNQKAQTCLQNGISFTFMGDGKDLAFVESWDLISLFGNILDNAIEASLRIPEKSRRAISITTTKKGGLVYISSMNYTSVVPAMVEGLPETTKTGEKGYHGFGMKSIRNIAEKYNGGLSISVEQDVFGLFLYLFPPTPAK